MHIDFSSPSWQEQMIRAYSFRFTETPVFTPCEGGITTRVNPAHREGFDNISLLCPEPMTVGVSATLRCAFDGLGCPEILLAEKPERCPDGAVRYGACFEVVLYREGVNVWRHFREADGRCHWHKRLGLYTPIAEGVPHELTVTVRPQEIAFSVDGVTASLRVEDLFPSFYLGVTACEGIVRLHELTVDP